MASQTNMICPGCQIFQPRAVICNSCGIVVAKVGKPAPNAAPRSTGSETSKTPRVNLNVILLIGLPVIAFIVFSGSENAEEVDHTTAAVSSDVSDKNKPNPTDMIAAVNPAAAARIQRNNVTSKLHALKTMLYQYSMEGDDPPTNDEGLQALVERRYLTQSEITDEWGNTFVYRLEWGKETPWGKEYKIFVHSKGPDGVSGNSDDVAMP
jgi:hypothetical protein